MRGWLFAMIGLGLVGCYAPNVPEGAPCQTDNECPEGQSCVALACARGGGGGAPIDAPGSTPRPGDGDGDGVADGQDNCPTVGNADQRNEDGDRFGDACDPCPMIKDDVGADADHDGIGDLCDPNPAAKDAVWVFDGFHGLPAWSRSERWSAVATGDKVQMVAGGNATDQGELMIATIGETGTPDNFQASTTVAITAVMGSAGDHEAGIEILDAKDTMPVTCSLEIDSAPLNPSAFFFLSDNAQNGGLDKSQNLAIQLNTEYRLTIARHGATYTCTVTRPDGTSATLTGTSLRVPRTANLVDIGGFGATAQFGSLEVIGHPLTP
ncbi:MAG TPA: thrombospondin type 3 repeat-containing protein [Kofleriaceae bacterium]|nr:thrombospondin type 3 repeat-containing protein [Kofleriaceae bacterium]